MTYLDLSFNSFKQLPAEVAQLAALQELSFKCNPDMKLALQDVEVFSTLGKLETLDLSKYIISWNYGTACWSAEDMTVYGPYASACLI